jgi:hypothetical protein
MQNRTKRKRDFGGDIFSAVQNGATTFSIMTFSIMTLSIKVIGGHPAKTAFSINVTIYSLLC